MAALAGQRWQRWKQYKDVAHLATAAVLICAETRTRFAGQSFAPFGLSSDQLCPFQMAMMKEAKALLEELA
jgi:hypothetical protein